MKDVPQYQFGDIVFRKTNGTIAGIVTALIYRKSGISYLIRFSDEAGENEVFDYEITDDKAECFIDNS